MPTPARKAAPRKIAEPSNAAEAAAAEVVGEDKVDIKFRGQDFVIDRAILSSARFLIAIASGQDHRVLFEVVGPENVDRFMTTIQRGERIGAVASEFIGAINKAAGWGNS